MGLTAATFNKYLMWPVIAKNAFENSTFNHKTANNKKPIRQELR